MIRIYDNVTVNFLLYYIDIDMQLLQRLQVLFKSIALRRSKNAEVDGKPIVDLPPKNIHMIHIDFNTGERTFYASVAKRAQARLEDAVDPDGKKLKVSYNKVCIFCFLF